MGGRWSFKVAALALIVASCSDDPAKPAARATSVDASETTHPRDRPFVPTTEPGVVRNIAREVAAELGCEFIQEIGREEAPIRGGAARRGVTCALDGVLMDVFEWAHDDRANLYSRVGHREGLSDPCGWLAIGERWFLVSGDRTVVTRAVEKLGNGDISEILPVSPIASYQVPGVSRCGG